MPDISSSERITLRDGASVTLRPIRADDAPRLQALYARLSPESVYFRFLGRAAELTKKEANRLAHVDYFSRMAIVAAVDSGAEELIIAVARYAALLGKPGRADFAIAVQDDYQGRGLGKIILRRLAAWAVQHGIHTFEFSVMYENDRMMQFLRHSGLPIRVVGMCQGQREIRMKLDEPAVAGD